MAKRKKRTAAEFLAAKATAISVSGYNAASPIYGLRLPEVIDAIESNLDAGEIGNARMFLNELRKRSAKASIIAAQLHA